MNAFSHPILSCADAGAWEKHLLMDEAGQWGAMERAGAAIARAVLEDFREIGGMPADARLLVLAGKGHNCGDALLAARELLAAHPGARAEVALFFGETALRPLARRSLDALRQSAAGRVAVSPADSCLDQPEPWALCLDGVFGFQFHPPMDGETSRLVGRINAHPRITLRAAVDLPSGLGDVGAPTVVRADFTYATGIVKKPAIADASAPFVGRLRYLDLGFFAGERGCPKAPDRVLLASILHPLAQFRSTRTDKRTYGHLFIVGGSRSYPGAVLLAAQAALRSGVGLLTAFVPESLVPEYAARFPEIMWVGWPEGESGGLGRSGLTRLIEQLPRASAVVLGPGLGAASETIAAVREVVGAAACPLLLDADALRPEVLVAAEGKRIICTPHAGEFERIRGEVDPSVAKAGKSATGTVIVLKGPRTRIFAPSPTAAGPLDSSAAVYHSLFGGPVLARGGSGDLLAGLTGGLLAQNPDDLLLAACRGVVWHGLAADLLARDQGQVAVQTTQLFDYLQPALRAAR